MDDAPKSSKLWSLVGICLPAIATPMAIFAALTTERRALWIGTAVLCFLATLLAAQRVSSAFKTSVLNIWMLLLGMVVSLTGGYALFNQFFGSGTFGGGFPELLFGVTIIVLWWTGLFNK